MYLKGVHFYQQKALLNSVKNKYICSAKFYYLLTVIKPGKHEEVFS